MPIEGPEGVERGERQPVEQARITLLPARGLGTLAVVLPSILFVACITQGASSFSCGSDPPIPDPVRHSTTTDVAIRRPSGRVLPLYWDLTQHLQEVIDSFALTGLAVGLVRDNEVVYAKGFGVEDARTRVPVTPRTMFHVASISKTFVATAVMQLAEEGAIDPDEYLVEYLPYFTLADDRYAQITVKQMLIHTSGFPDVEEYHWEDPEYDDEALERYVRSLSAEVMIGDPGAGWAYSNMAYNVLGDVIAKTSGVLFEEYEEEHVLGPAGMVRSTFLKPEGLPSGWASPHLMNLTPRVWSHYPYHRAHAPSSTLHSNILELCQWAIINLNHGSFGGQTVLHESTYSTLWQQHTSFPPGRGLFHTGGGQGIAWAIGDYRGEEVVGHSGSDTGFTSNLILVPGRSIAVVVLCNSTNFVMQSVTEMLLDAVLGFPIQPPLPPACYTVCRTLEESGLREAEEQWSAMLRDHPDEYDFSADYFLLIGGEIFERGTEEEAALLACLFVRIMPESEVAQAIEMILAALQDDPGNNRGEIMLGIMRGELGCPAA